jgi:hypothetical protein
MRGVALTQGTRRLVGQPLEGSGLVGAGALGCERLGLGRYDRGVHAWLGPGEMEQNEEPDECKQDKLIDKLV